MPDDLPPGKALLSFFLGPVQGFIEAAKTTRDLWAGSYTLSWLTVAAMRPLLVREDVEFVSPAVGGNPVIAAYARAYGFAVAGRHRGEVRGDRLLPCLPNRFLVRLPAPKVEAEWPDLIKAVRDGCRDEWRRIAGGVYGELKPQLDPLGAGWDALWTDQIESYFEVRAVVLPTGEPAKLRKLALPDANSDWAREFDVVSGLLDAERSVRHVPAYPVPAGDVPQKCTLLGSYEQLGPADLTASKEFWKNARPKTKTRGGAVRPRERLSAVSLVKRFAWPHFFCDRLRRQVPREVYLKELKFADTATTAARKWLANASIRWGDIDDWSGQWLHWAQRVPKKATPDEDPEDPCPDGLWRQIQATKAADGPPPAYYAVLMLDGDGLGKLLRRADPDDWGSGPVRPTSVSAALTAFALEQVQDIVEKEFAGELVYSGGDDTLALLPVADAVDCAKRLSDAYGVGMKGCTVSGGLAIVHYKEDLRFALGEARTAEKAAKNADRNKLALTVCRRGGEHATAVMTWGQVETFGRLVRLFIDPGVSDRWAYKLREELPILDGLSVTAVRAEVDRLLRRTADAASREQKPHMTVFCTAVGELFTSACGTSEGPIDPEAFGGFVTLCQSASFLARGRDR